MEIAKIGPDLRLGKERRPREVDKLHSHAVYRYHKLVRKRSKRTVTELRAFGPDLRLGGERSPREVVETSFLRSLWNSQTVSKTNKKNCLRVFSVVVRKQQVSHFVLDIFLIFFNGISYLTYLAGRVKFNPPFNLRFVLTSV